VLLCTEAAEGAEFEAVASKGLCRVCQIVAAPVREQRRPTMWGDRTRAGRSAVHGRDRHAHIRAIHASLANPAKPEPM
jgi:hypothetical protein